ncbi:MAG: CHASE2 domain-containing protein [Raineya sp.]|nr:CHASE2 domain-containing protein [Raineya sp.]MDW8296807.1 CHASE2 domain-containing protein [Raineya sp.]
MKGFVKYFFSKDVFIILLLTGVISFLVSNIKINLDALNPLEKMFGDFDLTDIYFSQIKTKKNKEQKASISDESSEEAEKLKRIANTITVVNIGSAEGGRKRLTELLQIINEFQPRCVGIDALYKSYKTDSIMKPINDALAEELAKTKNLVMAAEISFKESTRQKIINTDDEDFKPVFDTLITSHPNFMKNAYPGLVNLITEATRDAVQRQDLAGGLATCRTFPTKEKLDGKEYLFFGIKLAQFYAPDKVTRFLQRNNEVEFINYIGNYERFNYANFTELFEMYEAYKNGETQLKTNFENLFKDKIVLLGFTGVEDINKVTSDEDRFYTPLNPNYVGKAERDMYGVIIHANIIAMILLEEYIDVSPQWLDFLVSALITYLVTAFFVFLHAKLDFWYDGISILVQFLLSFLLVLIIIEVFDLFRLRVNWSLGFLAIVFIPNFVEVYYGAVAKIYDYRQRLRRSREKQVATLGVDE